MNHSDVIVVGAGPTGLMLACELAMRGVTVRLLDERRDIPNITRAFGVHARTLELLDARGLADELVQRGLPVYEVVPAPGAGQGRCDRGPRGRLRDPLRGRRDGHDRLPRRQREHRRPPGAHRGDLRHDHDSRR